MSLTHAKKGVSVGSKNASSLALQRIKIELFKKRFFTVKKIKPAKRE